MPDADAMPYLYNHLPEGLEMRVKIANPANIQTFFSELRTKWHESYSGRNQIPSIQKPSSIENTKAMDFIVRLAKDLQYTGLSSDREAQEIFIYDELKKRLGHKSAHIQKSPFDINTYATKKIKKGKIIRRLCLLCRRGRHTRVNCPRAKRTKKVNYIYHDDNDDSNESEEEYIIEEEDNEEYNDDEYDDDDNEYVDDDESQNCYALKKTKAKWHLFKKESQEIPYFKIS